MDLSFEIWEEWGNRTQTNNQKNKSDKQKIKDPVNSTFNSFLDFLVQLLFELTRIAQNLSITDNLVFGIPILLGPR